MISIYLDRILDWQFLLFATTVITGFMEYAKPAIIRSRLPGILALLRRALRRPAEDDTLDAATYEIAVRLMSAGTALMLLLGIIRPNWYGQGDVWENFTRNLPTAALFVVAAFGLMYLSDLLHRAGDRMEGDPAQTTKVQVDTPTEGRSETVIHTKTEATPPTVLSTEEVVTNG